MGQKIHPLGFRVGITKNHQSQWFARFNKQKYAQSILEDKLIRDTLSKLFPELLNPMMVANAKKRDEEKSSTPQITQIKIERGLIPYEIGVQIHAENCEVIKSSIDNLKIKQELICKLQKTRRYLLTLKSKLTDFSKNTNLDVISVDSVTQTEGTELDNSLNPFLDLEKKGVVSSPEEINSKALLKRFKTKSSKIKSKFGKKKISSLRFSGGKQKGYKFRSKLSKKELQRQKLIKKRLRKRQIIRSRYKQIILKGLFIKKTGLKIVQRLTLKNKKGVFNNRFNNRFTTNQKNSKQSASLLSTKRTRSRISLSKKIAKTENLKKNTFSSRIKKKFVTIFIQKMNKKFLTHLKSLLLKIGNKVALQPNIMTLGYSQKWSLSRLNSLKNQPLYKLTRMIVVLEQKLLIKLQLLRKEYITFGSLSENSSETFGYYQVLNFLKNLKELVNKLKREQKLLSLRREQKKRVEKIGNLIPSSSHLETKGTEQIGGEGTNPSFKGKGLNLNSVQLKTLKQLVVTKKFNQIDNESRKIKFIEYLKDIIKTHRTKNIYYYLSTIADARKDLRKTKQFIKRHSDFLFGLNSNYENKENKNALLTEKISKILEKNAKKTNSEKTLQDIFLEQLEKQKNMCLANLQLTPKISIKFYSVDKKTLDQKASVVAYSVVDALEKRKAFRKVVKDSKEKLMRTSGVKGVKIQVAGRLNGAEIARTEWVRAGRVPLQTLRANLDYSYQTASTIYGIIGVKVWIFKGYTKLIN